MNLLVERSKEPSLPSVHTFNTFFFPKLRSAGYSAVRRWTKKMDIFSVDILLVPVHLGVHWCLSVSVLRCLTRHTPPPSHIQRTRWLLLLKCSKGESDG